MYAECFPIGAPCILWLWHWLLTKTGICISQHKQTSLHYCVLTSREVFQYQNSGICTHCDSVQFANELFERLFRFWTDSLYLPVPPQCSDLVENLLAVIKVLMKSTLALFLNSWGSWPKQHWPKQQYRNHNLWDILYLRPNPSFFPRLLLGHRGYQVQSSVSE